MSDKVGAEAAYRIIRTLWTRPGFEPWWFEEIDTETRRGIIDEIASTDCE